MSNGSITEWKNEHLVKLITDYGIAALYKFDEEITDIKFITKLISIISELNNLNTILCTAFMSRRSMDSSYTSIVYEVIISKCEESKFTFIKKTINYTYGKAKHEIIKILVPVDFAQKLCDLLNEFANDK